MAKTGEQPPLNRAWIDSVTHQDHDHRRLWDAANQRLAANARTITELQKAVAALVATSSTASTTTAAASTTGTGFSFPLVFTGDSGSGGTQGLVPAPAPGSTAAHEFLSAFGGWQTVPAPTFVNNETPAGVIDGANKTFTLAVAPSPASSLQLFYRPTALVGGNPGALLWVQGIDYTLSGLTITTTIAPLAGDTLSAFSRH